MKPRVVLLMLALLGGGAYFLKSRLAPSALPATPAPEDGPTTGLSDRQKTEVLEFWKRFREAEAMRREGRFREAVLVYRSALELDPDHERSLYHLANSLIELDRYLEALLPLRHLVSVDPLSQRGHMQLGLVHSCPSAGEAFDLDSAEKELRRAVEINPEETGALLRLAGVLLVKGDLEQASRLYQLANQSNFRAVEGYYVRAFVHWKNGRETPARELLEETVRQLEPPKVVADLPGEGDTREGDRLPPSTIDRKRLIQPFWDGLDQRWTGKTDLRTEFELIEAGLSRLRSL